LSAILSKQLYALAPEGRIRHDKCAVRADGKSHRLNQPPALVSDRDELACACPIGADTVDTVRSAIEDQKAAVVTRNEARRLPE
jgi:hypothetical protein